MGTAPTDLSQGLLDVGVQVAAVTDGSIEVDFCVPVFGFLLQ